MLPHFQNSTNHMGHWHAQGWTPLVQMRPQVRNPRGSHWIQGPCAESTSSQKENLKMCPAKDKIQPPKAPWCLPLLPRIYQNAPSTIPLASGGSCGNSCHTHEGLPFLRTPGLHQEALLTATLWPVKWWSISRQSRMCNPTHLQRYLQSGS